METLQSFNPANGEVVGELVIDLRLEIDQKIKLARETQKSWSTTDIQERKRKIVAAYGELATKKTELAQLIHDEMGKPMRDAEAEVGNTVGEIEAFCDEIIEAVEPEVVENGGIKTVIYRDPYGVCVSIAPWNFPLMMLHDLILPALMTGNVVIMKPSEETPLTGKLYYDILSKHLPEFVLQFVAGRGEQGAELVAGDIDLVTFTGSKETGSKILQNAGKDLKRVLLELGGKDPMIVLDDADIDKAARFAVRNSFRNCGQVCVGTERIYVNENIADNFMSKLTELAKDIQIGPMVHSKQKQHVQQQIEEAVTSGAEIVYGNPKGKGGNFIDPIIMTNLNHDMSIMRDETFGPVACVVPVKTDEEAVRLANDTEFGLGAVVFGGDKERAGKVARKLTAAMVGINKSCGGASGTPWIGAGKSGYGFHSSKEGHRQFTQLRIVSEIIE